MTDREKYVKTIAETNFTVNLTSAMFAHELGARAILKILMDKKIISLEEWNDAIGLFTEQFVDLHVEDFGEYGELELLKGETDAP